MTTLNTQNQFSFNDFFQKVKAISKQKWVKYAAIILFTTSLFTNFYLDNINPKLSQETTQTTYECKSKGDCNMVVNPNPNPRKELTIQDTSKAVAGMSGAVIAAAIFELPLTASICTGIAIYLLMNSIIS